MFVELKGVALAVANATPNMNFFHLRCGVILLVESLNLSVYEVDVECCGLFGETGHAHDVARNDDEHLGTGIDDDVLYVEAEAFGCAVALGVGREGVLCLGNADGEVAVAEALNHGELLLGGGAQGDRGCSVEVLCYLANFLFYAVFVVVGELKVARRLFLDGLYHETGEVYGTFATEGIGVVHFATDTEFCTVLAYVVDFFIGIAIVFVEYHHNVLAERAEVAQVFVEVYHTVLQGFEVGFAYLILRYASVHLEGAGCGYEYGELGGEARLAALDVIELFGSEVGTETCFGNDIVGAGHGELGGEH